MPTVPYTLEQLPQAEEDIADLRGQIAYMSETGSGLNLGLPGTAGASFPGTTVTAASLTSLATATVTAGDPGPGAVYQLETWGNGTQASGTRQTLQFGVALGGNAMTNATFGTTAFEAVSQAFRFRVTARVICGTSGSSGTWTSYLDAVVADFAGTAIAPGNNDFASAFACESTGTTTADTTADQVLAVQAAWGGTAGSPALTSRVALFKRIA